MTLCIFIHFFQHQILLAPFQSVSFTCLYHQDTEIILMLQVVSLLATAVNNLVTGEHM